MRMHADAIAPNPYARSAARRPFGLAMSAGWDAPQSSAHELARPAWSQAESRHSSNEPDYRQSALAAERPDVGRGPAGDGPVVQELPRVFLATGPSGIEAPHVERTPGPDV